MTLFKLIKESKLKTSNIIPFIEVSQQMHFYYNVSLCTHRKEAVQTIDHLLWECFYTQHFWNQIRKYINNIQDKITKTTTCVPLSTQ